MKYTFFLNIYSHFADRLLESADVARPREQDSEGHARRLLGTQTHAHGCRSGKEKFETYSEGVELDLWKTLENNDYFTSR